MTSGSPEAEAAHQLVDVLFGPCRRANCARISPTEPPPTPAPQALLLDMTQVAELTGVPLSTLRHWRQLGTGPKSARVGRRVVYKTQDVTAWIDDQFA